MVDIRQEVTAVIEATVLVVAALFPIVNPLGSAAIFVNLVGPVAPTTQRLLAQKIARLFAVRARSGQSGIERRRIWRRIAAGVPTSLVRQIVIHALALHRASAALSAALKSRCEAVLNSFFASTLLPA